MEERETDVWVRLGVGNKERWLVGAGWWWLVERGGNSGLGWAWEMLGLPRLLSRTCQDCMLGYAIIC